MEEDTLALMREIQSAKTFDRERTLALGRLIVRDLEKNEAILRPIERNVTQLREWYAAIQKMLILLPQ